MGVNVGEIVLSLLALVFVVTRQVRPRPLSLRGLFVLPLVMGIIGAIELAGKAPLSSTDVRWVAIDLAVAVASALARAPTINLFERDRALWSQGSWVTIALWLVSFAARFAVTLIGDHDGAENVLGHGLFLSFGLSLAVQAAVISIRGARSGVPFAKRGGRATASSVETPAAGRPSATQAESGDLSDR